MRQRYKSIIFEREGGGHSYDQGNLVVSDHILEQFPKEGIPELDDPQAGAILDKIVNQLYKKMGLSSRKDVVTYTRYKDTQDKTYMIFLNLEYSDELEQYINDALGGEEILAPYGFNFQPFEANESAPGDIEKKDPALKIVKNDVGEDTLEPVKALMLSTSVGSSGTKETQNATKTGAETGSGTEASTTAIDMEELESGYPYPITKARLKAEQTALLNKIVVSLQNKYKVSKEDIRSKTRVGTAYGATSIALPWAPYEKTLAKTLGSKFRADLKAQDAKIDYTGLGTGKNYYFLVEFPSISEKSIPTVDLRNEESAEFEKYIDQIFPEGAYKTYKVDDLEAKRPKIMMRLLDQDGEEETIKVIGGKLFNDFEQQGRVDTGKPQTIGAYSKVSPQEFAKKAQELLKLTVRIPKTTGFYKYIK